MSGAKSCEKSPQKVRFASGLAFKTLIPIMVVLFLIVSIFGFYLFTTTRNNSKQFLIENILMHDFELLAKEKDDEFGNIKTLTEFTAQKIEDKIQESKSRTDEELDLLFQRYMSKKTDGSYRSTKDDAKGRYQMAAFFNNRSEWDTRHKGIFLDAFLFFDPFCESLTPFVFTTYFASGNSIWQYGFPDWALKSPANESFDIYNWFYEANQVHNPDRGHTWTDMYYDELQGQWMISSLMPIYDGDEFVGIVGQDFTLQKMIEVTKRSYVGEAGILFFVDNLDNIVAHPDTEYLIGETAENDERLNLKTLPDEPLTHILQELPAEKHYAFTEEDNRRVVMSFPLESVDWRMVYIVDEDELLQIADETNKQYILFFVFFTLFVIALLILVIHIRVVRPIKNFTDAAYEISKGNLDRKIDVRSNDEVGALAKAFETMRKEVKNSRDYLEQQVDARTNELTKKVLELEFNRKTLQRKQTELKKSNVKLGSVKRKIERFNLELERKVKERTSELLKAKEKIENLLDVKTKFVNQVAHDLRTPLTPIMALLPLIKKNVRTKDQIEKINVVLGNANYLSAIVRDTLNVARIDSGTVVFKREAENISEIVASVIDNNATVLDQSGIKTLNRVKKRLPKVDVDRTRILEVFENLVMNATKFMQGRKVKRLSFDASASKKFVTVAVKDTGIGIPKEHLKKIFDEFFKLDASRHEHSSGLGLSICRRIVEKHGGKIWAESPGHGKGSTFFFTLPIYKSKGGDKK